MSVDSRVLLRLPRRSAESPSWPTIRAHARYWAWQVASKSILGVIYLAVISEGLRVLIPALGQKVYKLPMLGSLKDYEATYRLDLAPFFAFFLLIGVFVLWPKIIALWVSQLEVGEWTKEQQLVVAMGGTILGTDAVLFYYAMTQMTWGSSEFSFSAFVATAAYVAVLVFASWMSIKLKPR